MRKTVNISLTDELKEEVDKAVKSGRYSSRSELFRDMVRLWKEEQILEDVRASRAEFQSGKGKSLRSLKDL